MIVSFDPVMQWYLVSSEGISHSKKKWFGAPDLMNHLTKTKNNKNQIFTKSISLGLKTTGCVIVNPITTLISKYIASISKKC
ncbi:hypothetical protein [Candidatus Nitrosocosmicus franklandus]|uniref:Uncharacterized protein n=1 Tax=Candidatus Nitrosocosmicus franklandianus TaxID=1798806 RepID=A0A484I6F6_9ARCH|nr:hypothetical protein [Candidatus Nitrosocosmicus franklandus]VFJ12357.1 protein of unknown function [Candidatus Nitrosocosmicus franklandus]